jgi:hypothetical protein
MLVDGGFVELRKRRLPKGVCDYHRGVYSTRRFASGMEVVLSRSGEDAAGNLVECVNEPPKR